MKSGSGNAREYDYSSLETVLSGEAQRMLGQQSAQVLAKYGTVRPELEDLHDVVSYSVSKVNTVLKTARKQLDPLRDRFDFTSKAGLDDLSLFRFINNVGGGLTTFVYNSYTRLHQMELYLNVLLPVLNATKPPELTSVIMAEESGSNLMLAAREEYHSTVVAFEKLLGGIYLGTRNEYKKLRKKFLGGTALQPDEDGMEDQLMMSFFGMKPPKKEAAGPAVALIDDNCILTQLFLDIADNLPRYYEKVTPVLKRGKLTGKTATTKFLDNGEVEDWAGTMISISDPTYWNYINAPSELTSNILAITKAFQTAYARVAPAIHALVVKADLIHSDEDLRFAIEDPNTLVKQYNRINFLSIRPSAEDIAPRTKMDTDMAIARNKLFLHLKETLTALSGMSHFEQATEDYAILRTKEAIELKKAMDDILKTEEQKNLARNIQDDNEFYLGKSGNLGSLGSEREPAPKISYEDVVGASFVTAKQHIEEVVKVASHPQIMRLSAPRGDVKSNIMLIGPYGCHRKGQEIIMYDGSLKKVEDIQVGDLLMGQDSTSREVLRLVQGVDDMMEIVPKKGDPWVVNSNHILSLMKTQKRTKLQGKQSYKRIAEIVDVPLNEYITWAKSKKQSHPLFRVGVDFVPTATPLPIDPYFLGTLLGDGCVRNRIAVTTSNQEIAKAAYATAEDFGLSVSIEDSCSTKSYHLSTGMKGGKENILRTELKRLNLFDHDAETKFIPQMYKTASKNERLALLAGLIDTDGNLHGASCYDYVTKSKQLADDITFVARSLGMAAYIKPCQKKSQTGAVGNYFRMIISGNVAAIPVRVDYKIASPRKQVKNVLHVGFSVNPLSKEQYFGFVLNGDQRYLSKDFTVFHNCGKSEMAKAIGADKRIIGFNVSTADMLTAYMHESVKNVKRMYDLAKDMRRSSRYTKPVGILMDEFDRLFTYGEGVHAAYDGSRMTGVLQEMMDGIVGYEGVFLVALTNLPKSVPEAVLRRFKYIDVVGQLSQEERAHLFKHFLTRGLPINPSVTQENYMAWSEIMVGAPGDVIGKVADEIHFKFMHELVEAKPEKVKAIEKALNKRLRDRESKKQDFDFIRKALGSCKMITAEEIGTALETVIKQPQVKMQIEKAVQVYKDSEDILKGLSKIGKSGLGFGGDVRKKSDLWGRE
jgi:hypothetical protein